MIKPLRGSSRQQAAQVFVAFDLTCLLTTLVVRVDDLLLHTWSAY